MESVLTESQGDANDRNLFINLNHHVERLNVEAGNPIQVIARDLVNDEERVFTAEKVVLAAGPIESPVIVKRSGLAGVSDLVGKGLTDHPSFFTHFAIPRLTVGSPSPYFDTKRGAKLIARYKSAEDIAANPFNIVIEVGADFNQGRYVNREIFNLHQQAKRDEMLCEVVFMLNVPLEDGNGVEPGPPGDRSLITMMPSTISPTLREAMNELKKKIVTALGGKKLDSDVADDADILHEARLGAAGHETGTMRLANPLTAGGGSVVDDDLKLRGSEGLYVCDLSVFPACPAANPSLTLAALALRLANHLAPPTA